MFDDYYLSIDIDYWHNAEIAAKNIQKVLRYVNRRDIPIHVVMNHQQMLKMVDRSEARTVINLDQHSDIVEKTINSFNCGSWLSYVSWRKEAKYIWARNHRSTSIGNCNYYYGDWSRDIDWKSCESIYFDNKSFDIKELLKPQLKEVGICLSPSYTPPEVYDKICPMLKGLPYTKGKLNEHFSVQRLPN